MKKNKNHLSLVILIALILLMCLAGYTFARYYKTVEAGTATSNIARWSFGAGDTLTTLNLSNEKIAPGTNGNFSIEVDATNSDVGVDYEVKFLNESNIPRKMKYYAVTTDQKGARMQTVTVNSLTELEEKIKGSIPVANGNQKRTVTVYWEWPFNENVQDGIDNEDGTLKLDSNGNPILDENNNNSLHCSFDIQIIGRQTKTS